MFDIGSCVVYRSDGVCVVSDIREENFGTIGKSEKYYILVPVNSPGSTVFVPVNNEALVSGMRPLLSASQINKLSDDLRDMRIEWIAETRIRNSHFKEILAMGDPRELILLINTLDEHISAISAEGRKPSVTDLNTLRRAEKILFDQFVSTTDITSTQEIVPLLRGKIKVSNKKS